MQIIIFALASIVAHSQFLPVNPFPNLTFVNPFKRSAPDAVVGFAIRCSSPRTWRNSPSSGLGSVCKEHPSPLSESDTCIMTRGTTIMDTFPAGAVAILVASPSWSSCDVVVGPGVPYCACVCLCLSPCVCVIVVTAFAIMTISMTQYTKTDLATCSRKTHITRAFRSHFFHQAHQKKRASSCFC